MFFTQMLVCEQMFHKVSYVVTVSVLSICEIKFTHGKTANCTCGCIHAGKSAGLCYIYGIRKS